MFKRRQREREALDAAVEELRRNTELAYQLTAQAGRELGRDAQEMLRAGEQAMDGAERQDPDGSV